MQFLFFIHLLFDNQFSLIILNRIILLINLRRILNKKLFIFIISYYYFNEKFPLEVDIILLLFYFQKKNIEMIFNFQKKNFPYLSFNKSNYSKVPIYQ